MNGICHWILSLFGWKIVGELPADKKFIMIAAPHTSNWDLIIGLIARCAVRRNINFLAKKEIFVFPIKGFLKWMGGTPVDRTSNHNRVEQIVDLFNEKEEFAIGLAPEGTRSPVKRWKFGFYYIAHQTQVPIVMVGFDYTDKEIRVSPPLKTTGDLHKDYKTMLLFFRTIKGRFPKEFPELPEDMKDKK